MPPVDDSVGRYRQRMADIERTMAFDELVAGAKREERREEQRKESADRKKDGDAAFKAGKWAVAVKHYSEAIELDFAVGNEENFTAVTQLGAWLLSYRTHSQWLRRLLGRYSMRTVRPLTPARQRLATRRRGSRSRAIADVRCSATRPPSAGCDARARAKSSASQTVRSTPELELAHTQHCRDALSLSCM